MRDGTSIRRSAAFLLLSTLFTSTWAGAAGRVGPLLQVPAANGVGWSHVIVRAANASALPQVLDAIVQAGGILGRALPIIAAQAAYLPNAALSGLANSPLIAQISLDRPAAGALERTGATVGATAVRQVLGYDGTGVTVAVIDSGITPWHDDLGDGAGAQRVVRFVDLVGGAATPYDDDGHGTHVAGIIAGNGFDSGGARAGIARGARLVVLKVLDANGTGRISAVIAALDYVVANRDKLNIRVVNLSVAAGVYESYTTDPLTLAAKRAVDAGIVVVAAAGNAGRDPQGHTMYGGITAPGNAPWVLTVGASSHMGTTDRSDDTVAAFSSRGPTAYDYAAKPDIVAPGVGIESLSAPSSAMYTTYSPYLLDGTVPTAYRPYLSLTGTSMAAPVVTGAVALMLQANPALTPNAVKAILEYTAERYDGYDALTEGAGFLNAEGAVQLARYFAAPSSGYPSTSRWSRRVTWGNHRVAGGQLTAGATAWSTAVTWGAGATPDGSAITWGATTSGVWAPPCVGPACGSQSWTGANAQNIVWGSMCGGADCLTTWTLSGAGATVYDTGASDTVVWSSSDAGTVVWGSSDGDTVVWGSGDGDTVVWGSSDGDTVVWGSTCGDAMCQPVLWNRY